jgi:tetratricopeptide (TPR) repeat protein
MSTYYRDSGLTWKLLNRSETSMRSLKTAILIDRNYCLKVDADRNFDGIRDPIQSLFESLHNETKKQANNAYQSHRQKLDPILSDLPSDTTKEAEETCRRIESYLIADTYFDYLDVLPEIQQAEEQLPEFRKALDTKAEAGKALEQIKELLEDYVYQSEEAKHAETDIRRLLQQAELLYREDTLSDYQNASSVLEQVQKIFKQIPPDYEVLSGHSHDVANAHKESVGGIYRARILNESSSITEYNKKVEVYGVEEGRKIATLNFYRGSMGSSDSNPLWSVSLSPDGQYLACECSQTLEIYRVGQRSAVTIFKHRSDSINFSPDGKYLASGGNSGVKVYGVGDWREITTLEGHSRSVNCVSFSPCGKYLASGSSDETAKVYSVADWKEIITLEHGDSVYFVSFSPDGKYFEFSNRSGSGYSLV